MKLRVILPVVLVTALIAGCGGGGGDDSSTSAASAPQTATQVVVQASDSSFNPAQIYKDVSPGVVTITSVFDTSGNSLLGGGSQAGQGSGFVVDTAGDVHAFDAATGVRRWQHRIEVGRDFRDSTFGGGSKASGGTMNSSAMR